MALSNLYNNSALVRRYRNRPTPTGSPTLRPSVPVGNKVPGSPVNSGGTPGFQENSGQQLGQPVDTPAPDRLRFDAQYAPLYRQLDEQQGRLASDYNLQSGRLQMDADAMLRRLGQVRDNDLRANEERMADNGILRSGINVAQQGRIGQDYVGGVNDLEGNRSRSLSDLARILSDSLSGLNSQRESLMAQQGRDETMARLQEAEARAQAEAQQRYLQNLLAQQPQPTPTGNYRPPGTSGQPAMDANYVRGMFNSYGVDPSFGANAGESPDQRISRIVQELAGGRTVNNLRNSLTTLRQRMRVGA